MSAPVSWARSSIAVVTLVVVNLMAMRAAAVMVIADGRVIIKVIVVDDHRRGPGSCGRRAVHGIACHGSTGDKHATPICQIRLGVCMLRSQAWATAARACSVQEDGGLVSIEWPLHGGNGEGWVLSVWCSTDSRGQSFEMRGYAMLGEITSVSKRGRGERIMMEAT